MIIGITGGIGSGKSTVVKMFSKHANVAVYNVDDQAKKLMNSSQEIKEKLIKKFSRSVYKNGLLNPSFLSNIVFNDKKKLLILNSIVHPLVKKHLKKFIEINKNKTYIIYENAILFEVGSDRICDKIITVIASKEKKIRRILKRDKITINEVLNRMRNQWDDYKKIIQSNYIINNDDLLIAECQVRKIHKILTKK